MAYQGQEAFDGKEMECFTIEDISDETDMTVDGDRSGEPAIGVREETWISDSAPPGHVTPSANSSATSVELPSSK